MAKRLTIAIDTGGTFTDCVFRRDGRVEVLKLASTPDDPGGQSLRLWGGFARCLRVS